MLQHADTDATTGIALEQRFTNLHWVFESFTLSKMSDRISAGFLKLLRKAENLGYFHVFCWDPRRPGNLGDFFFLSVLGSSFYLSLSDRGSLKAPCGDVNI